MLSCLTPHLQIYPAWLHLPGAQDSHRWCSSGDFKGTQASQPGQGTARGEVREVHPGVREVVYRVLSRIFRLEETPRVTEGHELPRGSRGMPSPTEIF